MSAETIVVIMAIVPNEYSLTALRKQLEPLATE
jgi:hypothetical protein